MLLAACGQQAHDQQQATANEQAAEAALPRFPCASGTAALAPVCTAERIRTAQGWVITVRHPDGHFRRLLVKDDNSVTAADGAQPAGVRQDGTEIEVAIANDRYRLPAAR